MFAKLPEWSGAERGSGRGAYAAALAVVAIISLSSIPILLDAGTARAGPPPPFTTVSATLNSQGTVGPVSPYFWSVSGQTGSPNWIGTDGTLDSILNQTPFVFIRYGEGADSCDVANDTQYVPPSGGSGNYVAQKPCLFNISEFKAWCYSLTPHCLSILQLPGEINSSSTVAYEANYIVHAVGFQPTLWAVGNEPTNWLHFGIPWKSWNTADNSKPKPIDYVVELRQAITAITAVDPGAQFVGVEAATYQNTPYFDEIAQNYSNIPVSWQAYHEYPSVGIANPTEIYAALSGTSNISTDYAKVRADLKTNCSTGASACQNMPIEIGEYNHGPSTGTPYADVNFTDALFLAASVSQALRANVSALTVFKLQSSTNGPGYELVYDNDTTDPAGTLFQKVFGSGHFQKYGTVYNTTVTTTASGVWSEMTRNQSSCYNGLVVVNTDLTHGLDLSLNGVFPTASSAGTITWWNASGNASGPVIKAGAVIPSAITMAPQSLLVLKDQNCSGLSGHGAAPFQSPGAGASDLSDSARAAGPIAAMGAPPAVARRPDGM